MSAPEAFIPLNGSAGNSAPVGGKRGSRKLKLVTRKQARKMLKKLGKKMRGGDASAPGAVVVDDKKGTDATGTPVGGRTRRHRKSRSTKLFGLRLKY